MKQYISFFKLKFAVGLQYKAAAIAGLATQIFFGLVFIMVYMAFYNSGEANVDISLSEIIQYQWLSQAFLALIWIWHKDNEILSMIKNGNVAYELCRPQNLYWMWYIRILASKLSAVLLRCIPLLIIAFLLPHPYNLILPESFTALMFFIITLALATLLVTALVTLMYLLIFYSVDSRGIMGMYCGIAEILSGQVIAIPLFPVFLRNIAIVLPFAYISDFSFRIYSGNIAGTQIIQGLTIQIIWLFIILFLGLILSNRLLKRVSVQGG
jgi:ABC-2 type transport system permease protein